MLPRAWLRLEPRALRRGTHTRLKKASVGSPVRPLAPEHVTSRQPPVVVLDHARCVYIGCLSCRLQYLRKQSARTTDLPDAHRPYFFRYVPDFRSLSRTFRNVTSAQQRRYSASESFLRVYPPSPSRFHCRSQFCRFVGIRAPHTARPADATDRRAHQRHGRGDAP